MKQFRHLLIIVIIFLYYFSSTFALNNKNAIDTFSVHKNLQVGEELTYVVKYSLIRLGEVRLKIISKETDKGKTIYRAMAFIDSYSGVPFVNLHQIYETKINDDSASIFFRGLVKGEKYTTFTDYIFDYHKSKIFIKKGKVYPHQLWLDTTITAKKKYQDGLSIFYYARLNTGEIKKQDIPCFVNEDKVYTKINYYNKVSDVSIDAVDYDIACVRIDGYTDFVSVFGLTGYFEGWFTNDQAAVPVVAKMKVIIGNITLELIDWKREGWTPPKYKL